MVRFTVADIVLEAERDLSEAAYLSLKKHLAYVEKYVQERPEFEKALHPVRVPLFVPRIIRDSAWAARRVLVGPRAALDGALIERLGYDLLRHTKEILVEKGSHYFLKVKSPQMIPAGEKLTIEISPSDTPCGIGIKSQVVIISRSAALASAAAAAFNYLSPEEGLAAARKIKGLDGVLIHRGELMGIAGKVKLHKA